MLTNDQRDKLTTLAFLGGIALALIGGGIWVAAPKPVNCSAEAADVETANDYLRNVPRAPLLGEDAYATARSQATSQLNRAKSAESMCQLKRSGAANGSGRKDMGVKVGIAGLAMVGGALFTWWREEDKDNEPVAQQPETAAAPPPPPLPVQPVPVYDYPVVDYPAYAEPEPEYTEPAAEAPRTRSGWGAASKRKLTFGDEGSES